MAVTAVQRTSLKDNDAKTLMTEVMQIDALRGLSWNLTSPEIIEWVWEKIVAATEDPDPLFEEKQTLNRKISDLQPLLKELIEESSDPLYTAVILAAIGNSIDIMIPGGLSDVENSIRGKLNAQVSMEGFSAFEERLKKSNLVAYCGDNAGEIITDELLIETIQAKYDAEIIFIVRSTPALNDVTLKEARSVGMDRIVSVVENGIDGPFPGTVLKRCSRPVRGLLEKADLIISKGGGNFETLDEEKHLKNISFLLLTKCVPHMKEFDSQMHQPLLKNSFRS